MISLSSLVMDVTNLFFNPLIHSHQQNGFPSMNTQLDVNFHTSNCVLEPRRLVELLSCFLYKNEQEILVTSFI